MSRGLFSSPLRGGYTLTLMPAANLQGEVGCSQRAAPELNRRRSARAMPGDLALLPARIKPAEAKRRIRMSRRARFSRGAPVHSPRAGRGSLRDQLIRLMRRTSCCEPCRTCTGAAGERLKAGGAAAYGPQLFQGRGKAFRRPAGIAPVPPRRATNAPGRSRCLRAAASLY